jgi:hypothetical protein
MYRTTLVALLGTAALAVAGDAGPAAAIVPPKNCGMMTVKGKRYNIKADQITCNSAKGFSRRYLSTHARPAGYRCRDYSGGTKLKFRCSRGIKVFFAIRRS